MAPKPASDPLHIFHKYFNPAAPEENLTFLLRDISDGYLATGQRKPASISNTILDLVGQVLQGAVGIASNQGLFARPDIGSGLLISAILVVVLLLFSKPVSRHLGTETD